MAPGRGTDVDLERDLGVDNSATIGYVGASWRPWENHEFGLTYYQDDADATRMITRDITFEDTTYTANSIVSVDVGIDAYEGYYVWWAAQKENWSLGPRLGLIWYRLDMAMALQVDVNGNAAGGAFREEAQADLPSLTLGGAWRWTPGGHNKWRIGADAGYFKANVNDVDGDVTFGRIGVEFSPGSVRGSRSTTRSARSASTLPRRTSSATSISSIAASSSDTSTAGDRTTAVPPTGT